MAAMIIEVCVGTSCHLMGSQDLIDALNTLPYDQRDCIEVRGITCLKVCGNGPSVRINDEIFSNMTPERLLQLVEKNLD